MLKNLQFAPLCGWKLCMGSCTSCNRSADPTRDSRLSLATPLCAGYHQLYAYYSANQYYNYDVAELDMNIQSADTTTTLVVNNSTTVAGQAITFTGARQHHCCVCIIRRHCTG